MSSTSRRCRRSTRSTPRCETEVRFQLFRRGPVPAFGARRSPFAFALAPLLATGRCGRLLRRWRVHGDVPDQRADERGTRARGRGGSRDARADTGGVRGALEFLERYAYGFLVALVPGPNRRLPLAVGLRLTRGWDARALQQVSKSARRNGTLPMIA